MGGKMKKLIIILTLFISSVASAGTLIVNSNQSGAESSAALKQYIADFEAANPDVKVVLNEFESESYKVAIRNFLTSETPDVALWFAGNRMKFFVDQDLFRDVSDVWEEYGLYDSMASSRLSVTVDDKQYGVPWGYYQWGMYYRTDIFDKVGLSVPTNFEELVAACSTLRENNITPVAIGTRYLWTAAGWFDYLNMRINGYEFHMDLAASVQNVTGRSGQFIDELTDKSVSIPGAATSEDFGITTTNSLTLSQGTGVTLTPNGISFDGSNTLSTTFSIPQSVGTTDNVTFNVVSSSNLAVGGLGVEGADGSSVSVNIPTVGRIPRGATVEKMVESPFIRSNNLVLNLNQGDFSTANIISEKINEIFGPDVAVPLDATSIKVRSPEDPGQKVSFVSLLENIEVEPARPKARVVINARTGTIVIGGDVKVTPTAVTHGKLTVSIQEDTAVVSEAQGAMQNANSTVAGTAATTAQDTQIAVEEENAKAFVFDTGTSLSDIVDAINEVGASAADMVAILEALREAGSLRAELIII